MNWIVLRPLISHVIKPATVRLILVVAVLYNWPICQLDVSNAFLHGHLEDEVFMEQPTGFEDHIHPEFAANYTSLSMA